MSLMRFTYADKAIYSQTCWPEMFKTSRHCQHGVMQLTVNQLTRVCRGYLPILASLTVAEPRTATAAALQ